MAGKKTDLNPWDEIRHFKPVNFACRCDGLCRHEIQIDVEFVRKLDAIAKALALPLQINSGTRCARYNERVIKSSPASPHVPDASGFSHAADVHAPNAEFAYKLVAEAIKTGIPHVGIGVGQRGQYWVHLDDSSRPAEAKMWAYPNTRR